MSLDIWLTVRSSTGASTTVYDGNVTHNLSAMADAAGIYKALWRPEELGHTKAGDIVQILTEGLAKLKADPAKFEALNPSNGWGSYEHFVPFVEEYLRAVRDWPEAEIEVSR